MENAQNSAKLGEKNDNIYIYNHTHLVYKYNKSEANKMIAKVQCAICGNSDFKVEVEFSQGHPKDATLICTCGRKVTYKGIQEVD